VLAAAVCTRYLQLCCQSWRSLSSHAMAAYKFPIEMLQLMSGNIASALNTIRCHFVVNCEQLHWTMQYIKNALSILVYVLMDLWQKHLHGVANSVMDSEIYARECKY